MTKSAFYKYDPSEHAAQYGWLWTEGLDGEPHWQMISTIEDEDDLRTYFVAADQTEDAELYAGQPFVSISEPPAPGDAAPGFMLTLDDYRGVRVMFAWEAEGCANDDFAETIRNVVENAVSGAKAQ